MTTSPSLKNKFRARLRAVLDWFHRPRLNAIVSDPAPAAIALTQEQLQAMLPSLLPEMLPSLLPKLLGQVISEALANPAANPEQTRALRAALLGQMVPLTASMPCSSTGGKIAKFTDNICNIGDSIITESSGNIGISVASPADKLEIDGSIRLSSTTVDDQRQLKFQAYGGSSPRYQWGISGAGGMQCQSLDSGTARSFYLVSSGGVALFQVEFETGNVTTFGKVGASIAPLNTLDAAGGAAIGSYAGVNSAPSNGLIVSGNVGIGSTTPQKTLTLGPSKMAAFEIATPGAPTVVAATVTGALPLSGTYFYKVAALDSSGGETAAGSESASASLSSGAMVSWATVAGASNYRIYRKISGGSYDKYILVPATAGGTQAFPDTGATLAGSGTPPSSANTFAIAVVVGSSTGGLTTTNPYWYTIAALNSSDVVQAVSAESTAVKLTTGQNSLLITWSQYLEAFS